MFVPQWYKTKTGSYTYIDARRRVWVHGWRGGKTLWQVFDDNLLLGLPTDVREDFMTAVEDQIKLYPYKMHFIIESENDATP